MSKPLVLVVDDSDDLCELVALVLAPNGYVTRAAGDGEEALSMLADGLKPQLILLDHTMPRMDGPATLAALQRDPELASIPVVLMTGERLPAAPAGFTRLLAKPYMPGELLEVVRTACAA